MSDAAYVSSPIVPAFAAEEEAEAKPLRELVPLDYTEEEKLAGASVQQRVAATVARINSRSGVRALKCPNGSSHTDARLLACLQQDVKSLIEQIPVETNALFAFPVDWNAVDQVGRYSQC